MSVASWPEQGWNGTIFWVFVYKGSPETRDVRPLEGNFELGFHTPTYWSAIVLHCSTAMAAIGYTGRADAVTHGLMPSPAPQLCYHSHQFDLLDAAQSQSATFDLFLQPISDESSSGRCLESAL